LVPNAYLSAHPSRASQVYDVSAPSVTRIDVGSTTPASIATRVVRDHAAIAAFVRALLSSPADASVPTSTAEDYLVTLHLRAGPLQVFVDNTGSFGLVFQLRAEPLRQ